MPTINRKSPKKQSRILAKTDRYKARRKIYNSKDWKKGLRLIQLRKQPLCQVCLLLGKTTLAECVHHITTFVGVQTVEEMYDLAFNEDNLCSLCNRHHQMLHNLESFKNKKEKDPTELAEYLKQNPTIENDFSDTNEINDEDDA